MDDFSLHVTTSSTFTYCSSYGVNCKLALRKKKFLNLILFLLLLKYNSFILSLYLFECNSFVVTLN